MWMLFAMTTLVMDSTRIYESIDLFCRGEPTEESLKRCGCTVISYLIDEVGIPPCNLILYVVVLFIDK